MDPYRREFDPEIDFDFSFGFDVLAGKHRIGSAEGDIFNGDKIADEIDRVLAHCANLIPAKRVETLNTAIDLLRECSVFKPSRRPNSHPLRENYKLQSKLRAFHQLSERPALVCEVLCHDSVTTGHERHDVFRLATFLRLAILLDFIGKPLLDVTDLDSICSYLRRFDEDDGNDARPILSALLNGDFDLGGTLFRLWSEELSSNTINQKRSKLAKTSLDAASKVILRKANKPAYRPNNDSLLFGILDHPKTTTISTPQQPKVPQSDEESPDLSDGVEEEPTLVISTDKGHLENISEFTEKKLNTAGHRLRLHRLWASMSESALRSGEVRNVLEVLHQQNTENNEYLALAVFLTSLVACTGRSAHELLAAWLDLHFGTQKSSEQNKPLKMSLLEGVVKLEFEIFNRAEYPSVSPKNDHYDHVLQTLEIFISPPIPIQPPNKLSKAATDPTIDAAEVESRTLDALEKLKKSIRASKCPRFTEARLRGAFVETALHVSQDISLVQHITGEACSTSDAGAHYIAVPRSQIQTIVDKSIQILFKDEIQSHKTGTDPLIGAPRGGLKPSTIDARVSAMVKRSDATLKEILGLSSSKSSWVKAFNALTEEIACLLLVATTHRDNKAFDQLTLKDIGLQSGLVMLRDKLTTPKILRRIAYIPPFVQDSIWHYLEFLEKFRSQLRNDGSASHAVEEAQKGTAPLFLKLEIYENKVRIKKFSVINLLKNGLLKKLPTNNHRHLLSSQLRKTDLWPVLIEQQLGHKTYPYLEGEQGLISFAEIASELEKPLTYFLQSLGFVTRKAQQLTKNYTIQIQHSSIELDKLNSADKKSDTGWMKKWLNTESTTEKSVNLALNKVLEKYIESYHPKIIPTEIEVSDHTLLKIDIKLRSMLPPAPDIQNYGRRQLNIRLRRYRKRYQWDVTIPAYLSKPLSNPPLYTKGHLIAYESLILLREDFLCALKQKSVGKKPLDVTEVIVGLMLFGGFYFEQAKAIVANCKKAKWTTKESGILLNYESNNVTEALCINGIAEFFLIGWILQNKKVRLNSKNFDSEIKFALPETWQAVLGEKPAQSYLDQLIKYGRYFELPEILYRRVTGLTVGRDFELDNLISWLSNSVTPAKKYSSVLRSPKRKNILSFNVKTTDHEHNDFKNLIKFVKRSKLSESEVVRKPIIKEIKAWVSGELEHSILIQLLSVWAIELLSPNSNRRIKDKSLRTETVSSYLRETWDILHPSLSGFDFTEYDEDTLRDLITEEMSEDPDKKSDEAYKLTRFFEEVSLHYDDVPSIAFQHASNRRDKKSISAAMISGSELGEIKKVSQSWRKSENLAGCYLAPLSEADNLLSLLHDTGGRRNEIAFMRSKDLQNAHNESIVSINPNHLRKLKTYSSHRSLQSKLSFENIHHEEDGWLFPATVSQGRYFSTYWSGIVMLCRWIKNDKNAVPHWLRHFKINDGFMVNFQEQSLKKRAYRVARKSAEVGHAAPSISFQYYFHSGGLLISNHYSTSNSGSVDKKLISWILGESYSKILKIIQRHGELGIKTKLLPQLKSLRTKKNIDSIPVLPDKLKFSERENTSTIVIVARWLNGESIDKIIKSSTNSLASLENIFSNFQESLKYPSSQGINLDQDKLLATIDWIQGALEKTPEPNTHRNLIVSVVRSWSKNAEENLETVTDGLSQFKNYSEQIQWHPRDYPGGKFSDTDISEVNQILQQMCLPITLTKTDKYRKNSSYNYRNVIFVLDPERSGYRQVKTVKFLLHFVLRCFSNQIVASKDLSN